MAHITEEQAREELTALLAAWPRAVTERDAGYFERHMDDGWRYTDYTGAQRGKAEYLELCKKVVWCTEDHRQLAFRVVGKTVAIVTGIYDAKAEFEGVGTIGLTLAFSAVWEHRDGAWRALLHHSSAVTP
jgi:hypothetical protein